MSDREFRNKLQERFENFSSQPSDAVWEQLDAHLDERDRKKILLWWLLALLMIGSVIAFFLVPLNHDQNGTKPPVASKNQTSEIQEKAEPIEIVDDISEKQNTSKKIILTTPAIDKEAEIKKEPELIMPVKIKPKKLNADLLRCGERPYSWVDKEEILLYPEEPIHPSHGFYLKGGSMFGSGASDLSFNPGANTFTSFWAPYTADEAYNQERTHKVIFGIEAGYFIHLPIGRELDLKFRSGMSYLQSKSQMYAPSSELFINNVQHSIGIPLTVSTRIPLKYFKLSAYLGIINQIELINPQEGSSNTLTTSNNKIDGYRLALQPGVEIGYNIFENVALNLSYGYRLNLVNNLKGDLTIYNRYMHVPEIGLDFYLK